MKIRKNAFLIIIGILILVIGVMIIMSFTISSNHRKGLFQDRKDNASLKAENSSLKANMNRKSFKKQTQSYSNDEYAVMTYLNSFGDSGPSEAIKQVKEGIGIGVMNYSKLSNDEYRMGYEEGSVTIRVSSKSVSMTDSLTSAEEKYTKTSLSKKYGKYKSDIDQLITELSNASTKTSSTRVSSKVNNVTSSSSQTENPNVSSANSSQGRSVGGNYRKDSSTKGYSVAPITPSSTMPSQNISSAPTTYEDNDE